MSKKSKYINLHIFRRTIGLAAGYKTVLVGLISLTILQSMISALQPYLYQFVLDEFVQTKDLEFVKNWFFILLGVLVILASVGTISAYFSAKIGQNVILDTRQKVYNKILALKTAFFDTTPVGLSVTRVVSDIETLASLFASGIITIIGDLFQILIIAILMFLMNWKLAIVTLLVLPLLLYSGNIFRKGIKNSFQNVRAQVSELNAFLQEHITGMAIIKLFSKQDQEFNKFKSINAKHRDAHLDSVYYYSIFFPVVDIFVSIAFALLIWFGSLGIAAKFTSPGELTAFIMFINMFFRPIRTIADRFNNIQMGMVAAERIFEIIDNQEDLENDSGHLDLEISGAIEFKNVQFSYTQDFPVLKDISFKLKAGETLAIIGSTGSGKSTIMNLIPRFYEHQKGDILIDENPIQNYSLRRLRRSIGVVPQDVFLFSGSLHDNITINRENIDLQQAEKIAKEIDLYDFINGLPGGFGFNVMERGQSLSLGQRQLLSFIRAVANNPSIIIMDEATSSIDSETELLLQRAIETLLSNRTALVVAHRLSTVVSADIILVLDQGVIVEQGTHATLLKKNGHYAKFYHRQLMMQGQ
ncbi:MAG: ABC transporter ATP-binding protein [Bacteroidia bacterium]|nr:ABC transporter ATP-binding protein [Bacteroidia bacterium]